MSEEKKNIEYITDGYYRHAFTAVVTERCDTDSCRLTELVGFYGVATCVEWLIDCLF